MTSYTIRSRDDHLYRLDLLTHGEERVPRHDVWLLLDWFWPHGLCGYSYVFRPFERSCPSHDRLVIYEAHRGRGLATAILQTLIRHYGELRSDSHGQTNDVMCKVWEKVGRHDPINCPCGQSRYYLRAADLYE